MLTGVYIRFEYKYMRLRDLTSKCNQCSVTNLSLRHVNKAYFSLRVSPNLASPSSTR